MEWFVIMFGTWVGGVKACSTHVWKQLRMDHRPVRQRVGEEGGRARLGKSEGGGGRKGSSQWKKWEKDIA